VRDFREGSADFGATATAIGDKEAKHVAHAVVVGGVNDGPTFAPGPDQSGMTQDRQVRRKRVRQNADFARDGPRGQALGATPDEQPKDGKPVAVGKRRKSFDGFGERYQ
jgi:hypothetical protein